MMQSLKSITNKRPHCLRFSRQCTATRLATVFQFTATRLATAFQFTATSLATIFQCTGTRLATVSFNLTGTRLATVFQFSTTTRLATVLKFTATSLATVFQCTVTTQATVFQCTATTLATVFQCTETRLATVFQCTATTLATVSNVHRPDWLQFSSLQQAPANLRLPTDLEVPSAVPVTLKWQGKTVLPAKNLASPYQPNGACLAWHVRLWINELSPTFSARRKAPKTIPVIVGACFNVEWV